MTPAPVTRIRLRRIRGRVAGRGLIVAYAPRGLWGPFTVGASRAKIENPPPLIRMISVILAQISLRVR